jgi:hypothetical protein
MSKQDWIDRLRADLWLQKYTLRERLADVQHAALSQEQDGYVPMDVVQQALAGMAEVIGYIERYYPDRHFQPQFELVVDNTKAKKRPARQRRPSQSDPKTRSSV